MLPTKFPRGNGKLEDHLIAAVKKRRPLWDPNTPLHKNVKVLVYLWHQVAKELGVDEPIVKKKWKSLRDYFFRQVRCLEKSSVSKVKGAKLGTILIDDNGTKNIVAFRCMWPLYDKLTFLTDNKITPHRKNVRMSSEDRKILEEVRDYKRQCLDEISAVNDHVSSDDSASTFESQQSNKSEILSLEKPLLPKPNLSCVAQRQPQRLASKCMPNVMQDNGNSSNTTQAVMLSSTPQLIIYNPTPSSIQERDPLQEDSNRLESLTTPKLESGCHDSDVQQNTDDDDEDDDLHFFKSLLPFMRAFSLRHKLRVRNEIQSLILGELESSKHNTEYLECLPHDRYASPTTTNCTHMPKTIVDLESRDEQVLDHISSPVMKEEAESTEDEAESTEDEPDLLKVYKIKSEPL